VPNDTLLYTILFERAKFSSLKRHMVKTDYQQKTSALLAILPLQPMQNILYLLNRIYFLMHVPTFFSQFEYSIVQRPEYYASSGSSSK